MILFIWMITETIHIIKIHIFFIPKSIHHKLKMSSPTAPFIQDVEEYKQKIKELEQRIKDLEQDTHLLECIIKDMSADHQAYLGYVQNVIAETKKK